MCVVIDVSLHFKSKSCFSVYYKSLANLVVTLSLVVQVYICKPSCCKWNLFYLFGKHLHFSVHLCPCPLWPGNIVLYNVNLFLQIESDFLKIFYLYMVSDVWTTFLFIIVRNILFYNIVVDSVNTDMLGFGSFSIEVRVLCIIESIGLRYLLTKEANAFSILLKCDVIFFFFVQKSTVFLNSLLPSKSKSVW